LTTIGPSLEAGLRLRRRADDEVGLGACVLAVSSSTLPSLVRTSAPETSLVINPEPARESSMKRGRSGADDQALTELSSQGDSARRCRKDVIGRDV